MTGRMELRADPPSLQVPNLYQAVLRPAATAARETTNHTDILRTLFTRFLSAGTYCCNRALNGLAARARSSSRSRSVSTS